jgi:phosphoribosyl-AMP cyclohydrolase
VPLGDVAKAVDNLHYEETEKTFDPKAVYGDAPNPTQL